MRFLALLILAFLLLDHCLFAEDKRPLKIDISYDVPPAPGDSHLLKIIVSPLDNPGEKRAIAEGDLLAPGTYKWKITRWGYEQLVQEKRVEPGKKPYIINEVLIAKRVPIHIDITYDIPAPEGSPGYAVYFVDMVGMEFIDHGHTVRPGDYDVSIFRAGYSFGRPKPISVFPGEQPYMIKAKATAMPRNISFDMIYENRLIPVHAIINAQTSKRILPEDMFPAGHELDLIIKCKRFATIQKRVKIVPGQGPLVINAQLKQLKRYDSNMQRTELKLDDITYGYQFHVNGKRLEFHHVEITKAPRFYWTIWVDSDAKNLRVIVGYLYAEKPFDRLHLGIGTANNIDIQRLLEHLDNVAEKYSRRASLEAMERMLRTFAGKRRLRQCQSHELDQLIQFIVGWKREIPVKDHIRIQRVMESIEKEKRH